MASDPPGSSPASPKSESVQSPREDAETSAARKELRNTTISESNDDDGLRSSTPEVSGEDVTAKDEVLSPKKKRAHDQVEDDQTATTASLNGRAVSLEPEKKRQRDELQSSKGAAEAEQAVSDTTPAVPSSKPTLSFADSSLSGFAASPSPFSALSGSSKGSGFGSAPSKESSGSVLSQAPTLNFSQTTGASPFSGLASTTKSGFGGSTFGSAFGSPFAAGSSGRLSSFAKPGESLTSEKKHRAFGAPDSDAEEDSDDGESDNKASSVDGEGDEKDEAGKAELQAPADDNKKLKLQKVAVDTGESGEATIVQVRAKMYFVDNDNKDAGWKERGAGLLKINVPASCVDFDDSGNPVPGTFDASGLDDDDSSSAFRGARLLMRQDQTHRLLLNTVLLPAMTFQEKASLKAVNVLFTAFDANEGGNAPRGFSVNMKMSAASAKIFMNEISTIQRELQSA
ncbi:uncharacterized protein DNG_08492 [Cephalotrichum gorgonifer]|uniref:RanBD1 domain-containing protein n=1 Tax=Cephalotrichum gorgonifer TaxID=2041049 RepID=A0AAE8SYE5_9PEZI|nr:uncharacterized protein DNG_08492 [Cephalotrichum gorgonifer]